MMKPWKHKPVATRQPGLRTTTSTTALFNCIASMIQIPAAILIFTCCQVYLADLFTKLTTKN